MPRILIVDDDANLRVAIRRMLAPLGFEIDEVSNGREAQRAFRSCPADLILCDIFMPEQDGLELLRELSRQFVGVKVISMSGGGTLRHTLDLLPIARSLGAVGVLHKPFEQAELLRAVKHALTPLPV
jgi:CheY-like chemotaxis protein